MNRTEYKKMEADVLTHLVKEATGPMGGCTESSALLLEHMRHVLHPHPVAPVDAVALASSYVAQHTTTEETIPQDPTEPAPPTKED